MHNSGERLAQRPATVVLIALLLAVGTAAIAAATAHAAQFKMVTCAGNTGPAPYSTQTSSSSLFQFSNYCGGQGGDPPGSSAFLRINETQSSGSAAQGAYGRMVFATPNYVHFKAVGAYTREPNAFNAGWLARFRVTDFSGNTTTLLNQGAGLPNSGIDYAASGIFGPHLWPFGGYMDFHHFYFELRCNLPGGCDRRNYNAVDANAFLFILSDDQNSEVYFTSKGTPLIKGEWVKGSQWMSWYTHDNGSGLRNERIRVDGTQRHLIDHQALAQCNPTASATNGEFARSYEPCPHGPYDHSFTLDTQSLSDGPHRLSVCTQDYGQYQGLNGTGGESCDQRTIRIDNHAPGAPAGLEVISENPARYLDRFGARFSLPPNSGSPIAKLHYYVTDDRDGDRVVVPEKVLAASDPTSLPTIAGPDHPGAYTLHVALEDQVGLRGPFAAAPVPHDTTPPAAPQELRVAGPTARWVGSLDLRWRNVTDAGSPIDTAHYQVVDAAGKGVGPAGAVGGEGVQAIGGLPTPARRGAYEVRVWLSDREGNVGAAASVPVPRDTTPPAAPQGVSVVRPATSRSSEGLDVRWHDIADDGAPIDAAHYQVLDGAGRAVVPTTTVVGRGVEAIEGLDAPRGRGAYALRLWLSDAEGNVGAPVTVPLAYECVRSDAGPAVALGAGVGRGARPRAVVRQGRGAVLTGRLTDAAGRGVADAPLCVFGRVLTDGEREFLGLAVSGAGGAYRFALPAGPSRELTIAHRFGHRELSSTAHLYTRVRPYFKVRRKVVRNKGYARFYGRIPGPHNDRVVVVLQVRRGKGWLAFRRYRTRAGGRIVVGYRFSRTTRPTRYAMRAQVRAQSGYPYLQGTSKPLRLVVLPARHPER